MSKLLEIQILSALAALALGAIALVYPILFFRNPDREWAFVEKWRRYGGQPSLRTPEWERIRKIPHVVLILLGTALLVGGIYLLGDALVSNQQTEDRFAHFDAIEVTECSLESLTIESRASSPRWIEIGPMRALSHATTHSGWEGRPVALSMDAFGAGIVPSQIDVVPRAPSAFSLAPGKTRTLSLDVGPGSCAVLGAQDGTRDCKHLVFRLRSSSREGASAELDVLRYCTLR